MNSTYTFSVIWLSVCLFGSNNRKKKKASFFSRSELKWTRQNSISAWADCFVDIMHYHTLLLPFSNYCCTALSVITQSLSSYTVTLFSWLRGLRLMLESAVWVWWGGKICDDQLFTFTFFSLFQKATIHPSIHPSIHAHTLTHSHTHTHTHRQLPSHSVEAGVCKSHEVWWLWVFSFFFFLSFGCSRRWWNSQCESLLLALASFHKTTPTHTHTHTHTKWHTDSHAYTQNHTHYDCWQRISKNPSSEFQTTLIRTALSSLGLPVYTIVVTIVETTCEYMNVCDT